MENSNENAHLNIETVTPDTEKDGQPNDQKHNHRVENEGAKESDEKPAADQSAATQQKEPYAVYEKSNNEKEKDSPAENVSDSSTDDTDKAESTETPTAEESAKKDDAADDIETVAP